MSDSSTTRPVAAFCPAAPLLSSRPRAPLLHSRCAAATLPRAARRASVVRYRAAARMAADPSPSQGVQEPSAAASSSDVAADTDDKLADADEQIATEAAADKEDEAADADDATDDDDAADDDDAEEEEEDDEKAPKYSLRARLREETEAPFRKARMFVYGGSAASAGVGALISFTRIIAAVAGVSGTQPLTETVPNLGVDVAAIALFATLLRLEARAGEKRLKRMSRGAALARLRVEDVATGAVSSVRERRGRARVVVVAGGARGVRAAMVAAEPARAELDALGVEVVPFIARGDEGEGDGVADEAIVARRGWRRFAAGRDEWRAWLDSEVSALRGAMRDRARDGDVVVLIVRLDGKVGARSVGPPLWDRLVEEVRKLPNKDQYGRP